MVFRAMSAAHPYEEVAYDRVLLQQRRNDLGAGMVGELDAAMPWEAFADHVKETLGCGAIKHTAPVKDMVKRVAVCGGSGAFLIADAKRAGADCTSPRTSNTTSILGPMAKSSLDVGHYESEWQTSG